MTFYHISLNENLTQLMPKIPKSTYGSENKLCHRVCFSGSIKGCCIAIPSYMGVTYTVYKASLALLGEDSERNDFEKIMIKPTINKVPDVEFTDEYWFTGLGVEVEPIGQIQITPTGKVLGKVDGYPVEDYDFKWIQKYC